MDVRPITTEAEYDWALREIEWYFDQEPAPGTPAAGRFDVLATLIDHYEARHWPIAAPDPDLNQRIRDEAKAPSPLAGSSREGGSMPG